MRKQKIGRRASAVERAHAQKIVDLYEKAAKEPNGRLLMYQDEPPEDQMFFDSKDPASALQALEWFAKYGSFSPPEVNQSSGLLALSIDFDELREKGFTHEEATGKLAEVYHVDKRTIERWLATPIGDACIVKESIKFLYPR